MRICQVLLTWRTSLASHPPPPTGSPNSPQAQLKYSASTGDTVAPVSSVEGSALQNLLPDSSSGRLGTAADGQQPAIAKDQHTVEGSGGDLSAQQGKSREAVRTGPDSLPTATEAGPGSQAQTSQDSARPSSEPEEPSSAAILAAKSTQAEAVSTGEDHGNTQKLLKGDGKQVS